MFLRPWKRTFFSVETSIEVPVAQATRKARKKSKSRHCQVKIRVMEAVEKCIKQIGERGLENPTNFPSALLFSNLALKLNSLRWSIYVFNSVVNTTYLAIELGNPESLEIY